MGATAFALLLAFNLAAQGFAQDARAAAPVAISTIAPSDAVPALRGPYN